MTLVFRKTITSTIQLTTLKMLATILLKELAFSDSVRRLQQTGDHDTTYSAASSESDSNRGGIYISIVGLAIIVVSVAISCFAMIRILNNVDDLELLDDKSVHTTPKSTLAERKQAILDIFETSQVTMVSNDAPPPTVWQAHRITKSRK